MRALVQEPRILAGIGLMLAATLAGALFLQHASQRASVWQFSRSLAAGTVLSAADVHLTEVAMEGSVYARAADRVVGRQLARDVTEGELLALASLHAATAHFQEVVVPTAKLHLPPDTRRGQRVAVWWSSRPDGSAPTTTARVLASARVLGTTTADVGAGQGVVLAVAPKDVQRLVLAIRSGDIDLVRLDTSR